MEKKEMEALLKEHKQGFDDVVKKHLEAIKEENAEEAAKLEAIIKEKSSQIETLSKGLEDLEEKVKHSKSVKKNERVSLEEELETLVKSDDFVKARKSGFKDANGKLISFSVKADTGDLTGDVNRTLQNLTVTFDPERMLAFIPNMRGMTIGQDKNRALWTEGSYTSNVGYISELQGPQSADQGSAEEKYREMADIGAFLPITEGMLEDMNWLASAFRMKLQERVQLFADKEAYDGDGSDGVNPKHIYGLVGQSTPFDAVAGGGNDGVNGTIQDANIGDVTDVAITQIGEADQPAPNILWMRPKDFLKYRTAKGADGQYLFVPDVNGNYTINGMRVVRNTAVTENTMLIGNTSKLQFWTKRSLELQFGKNGNDFINNAWTALVTMRGQVVVEGPDQGSLVYVSDIEAAIAACTKPLPTP